MLYKLTIVMFLAFFIAAPTHTYHYKKVSTIFCQTIPFIPSLCASSIAAYTVSPDSSPQKVRAVSLLIIAGTGISTLLYNIRPYA